MWLLNMAPDNELVDLSPSTDQTAFKKMTPLKREPTHICPRRIAPAARVAFSRALLLGAWFGITTAETVIHPLGLPVLPTVFGTVDV